MAAVIDIHTAIYQKIWELLEGDDIWPTLVPVGNRIKYDQVTGTDIPYKSNRADGDFNEAMLEGPVSGRNELYMSEMTFETHSPEGPNHWLERENVTYRLTLTTQTLKLGSKNALALESIKAIRKGGPKLGLSPVVDVQLQWQSEEIEVNEELRTMRWKTRILISVGSEYDGATMLGE